MPPLQQKIENNAFKFIKRNSFNLPTAEKLTFEEVFASKIGVNNCEKIDIHSKSKLCQHYKYISLI